MWFLIRNYLLTIGLLWMAGTGISYLSVVVCLTCCALLWVVISAALQDVGCTLLIGVESTLSLAPFGE